VHRGCSAEEIDSAAATAAAARDDDHNRDLETDDRDHHHSVAEPHAEHVERCWDLRAGVDLLARQTRVLGAEVLGRDSQKRLWRIDAGRRKNAKANEIYLGEDRGHDRRHDIVT
jgi:hypothetical protein